MTQSDNEAAIQILDKMYRFRCHSEEEESLHQAAIMLDGKMREIRDTHKIAGTERIAVMAALNLCHEFLLFRTESDNALQNYKNKIHEIIEKISEELTQSEQLEL